MIWRADGTVKQENVGLAVWKLMGDQNWLA
jgi:hypothetical protein